MPAIKRWLCSKCYGAFRCPAGNYASQDMGLSNAWQARWWVPGIFHSGIDPKHVTVPE